MRKRYERERDEAWGAHFARLNEGIALQRAGKLEEALAFYGQVMRECPDEPNTVYLNAQAHLQAGELQAARFAPRVWGVQLHPEVDDAILREWAEEDPDRYAEGVIEDVLATIEAAREELVAGWRPLASGRRRT